MKENQEFELNTLPKIQFTPGQLIDKTEFSDDMQIEIDRFFTNEALSQINNDVATLNQNPETKPMNHQVVLSNTPWGIDTKNAELPVRGETNSCRPIIALSDIIISLINIEKVEEAKELYSRYISLRSDNVDMLFQSTSIMLDKSDYDTKPYFSENEIDLIIAQTNQLDKEHPITNVVNLNKLNITGLDINGVNIPIRKPIVNGNCAILVDDIVLSLINNDRQYDARVLHNIIENSRILAKDKDIPNFFINEANFKLVK